MSGPGEAPAGARGALERASAALQRGGSTEWGSPSRLGGPGIAARRGLRRGLRPLEFRQRELDAAILDAIAEVARSVRGGGGAVALAAMLDGERVERLQTRLGPLWVRRDDVLVAPTIRGHGIYGTEIGAFLERRLRVGSTFVDVGANLGWFSVLASSLVGDRGRVFAVEPDPANLPLLRANLWGNRCDNATVLGVAAWSEPAHLDLVTYPEGGAATEVRAGGDGGLLVPAAPLDVLIPGTVDVLKIDAQMTDHIAVRGAERIIATSPRIAVIAEFFPAALRDKGEDPERILDYYLGLGLDLGMLDREGRGEIEAKTPAEIFAACENPEIPFVDVVLSKA